MNTLVDYVINSRMGTSKVTVRVTEAGEVTIDGQGIGVPGIVVPRNTSVTIEVGTDTYRGPDIPLRTRITRL